jgi:hypothetical protein
MSQGAGVDFGLGGNPRMRGFKTRATVDELVAWIVERIGPLESECVGRSRPGLRCTVVVGPAEAVEVATGAPLPSGTDAVESARVDGDRVRVSNRDPGPRRSIAALPRSVHSQRAPDAAGVKLRVRRRCIHFFPFVPRPDHEPCRKTVDPPRRPSRPRFPLLVQAKFEPR